MLAPLSNILEHGFLYFTSCYLQSLSKNFWLTVVYYAMVCAACSLKEHRRVMREQAVSNLINYSNYQVHCCAGWLLQVRSQDRCNSHQPNTFRKPAYQFFLHYLFVRCNAFECSTKQGHLNFASQTALWSHLTAQCSFEDRSFALLIKVHIVWLVCSFQF